jgi:hypothetical protein
MIEYRLNRIKGMLLTPPHEPPILTVVKPPPHDPPYNHN